MKVDQQTSISFTTMQPQLQIGAQSSFQQQASLVPMQQQLTSPKSCGPLIISQQFDEQHKFGFDFNSPQG